MIASTQIADIGTFAFIAVLVFALLSRKVLFVNEKTIETSKKYLTFQYISIALNLTYNKNKLHKTLDYSSRDICSILSF